MSDTIYEKEYEIKRVGWKDENPITPMILLDLKERKLFEKNIQSLVKVKKKVGDIVVECVATVQPQFFDLLRQEVVSINKILSSKLEVQEGDKIIIDKQVTETEVEKFKNECMERNRNMFMGRLGFM